MHENNILILVSCLEKKEKQQNKTACGLLIHVKSFLEIQKVLIKQRENMRDHWQVEKSPSKTLIGPSHHRKNT